MRCASRNVSVVFIFLCFSMVSTVSATTFRYEFVGTVTSAVLHEYGEELPDIQAGDTFTGFLEYRFDPSMIDAHYSNVNVGIYKLFASYSIIFDEFVIHPNDKYLTLEIANGLADSLNFFDPSPSVSNLYSDDLKFFFKDLSGNVFSSVSQDPFDVNFSSFDDITLWFDIYGKSGYETPRADGEVWGKVNTIYQVPVPVPEPATYLLLMVGFCATGMLNRMFKEYVLS